MKPTPITKSRLLAVEGKDMEKFFEALTGQIDLKDIQIFNYGGITELRAALKALSMTSGFEKLVAMGVVRDNEVNPRGAFQSVQDALKNAGLAAPSRQLVPKGKNPRVNVMLLPEPGKRGMLEDLLLRSARKESAMRCAKDFFDCLKERKLPMPKNRSKAMAQVYLASKPEVDIDIGISALKGYWDLDNKVFEQAKAFLLRIFS